MGDSKWLRKFFSNMKYCLASQNLVSLCFQVWWLNTEKCFYLSGMLLDIQEMPLVAAPILVCCGQGYSHQLTESLWWFPSYLFALVGNTLSLSWSRGSWGTQKASKKTPRCPRKGRLLHKVFRRSIIFHLSQLSENHGDLRAQRLGGYDRNFYSEKMKY